MLAFTSLSESFLLNKENHKGIVIELRWTDHLQSNCQGLHQLFNICMKQAALSLQNTLVIQWRKSHNNASISKLLHTKTFDTQNTVAYITVISFNKEIKGAGSKTSKDYQKVWKLQETCTNGKHLRCKRLVELLMSDQNPISY